MVHGVVVSMATPEQMRGCDSVNKTLIERAKEAIEMGKKNGRILDISEAFKKYPIEDEIHKGKLEYFQQKDKK